MSEMAFKPRVTTIPATLNRFTAAPLKETKKRRVAAYARVSTSEEEQQTSYENQVEYYTSYIMQHDNWRLVDIFTDEGITGTSIKRREGFNAMIDAAMRGEIDLIVTKSVSRFARNTVDSLTTVRKLKERGIEVFFEKENIYTLDSKGELLITIMSSLAQEESRSISENVSWGIHKRFADGKVSMPYAQFLGYRKGANDKPEIVPEEAEIVRDIYRWFLEGKSPSYIAGILTDAGIPSPAGKPRWRPETVKSILRNEKYKGDAILQKTFCTDFLTKRQKTNTGELPQYYVDQSHPAIIDPQMWDAVQNEMGRRSAAEHRNITPYAFSGKIFCGECGGMYGSKTWNGQRVWKCNNKHAKVTRCRTIALRDKTIEDAFVAAFNQTMAHKDMIISICDATMTEYCDISGLEAQKDILQTELAEVSRMMADAIYTNARVALDQDAFNSRVEGYERRLAELQDRIAEKEHEIICANAKLSAVRRYLDTIRKNGLIQNYDEQLWLNTVDRVTIDPDGIMHFVFVGGITCDC